MRALIRSAAHRRARASSVNTSSPLRECACSREVHACTIVDERPAYGALRRAHRERQTITHRPISPELRTKAQVRPADISSARRASTGRVNTSTSTTAGERRSRKGCPAPNVVHGHGASGGPSILARLLGSTPRSLVPRCRPPLPHPRTIVSGPTCRQGLRPCASTRNPWRRSRRSVTQAEAYPVPVLSNGEVGWVARVSACCWSLYPVVRVLIHLQRVAWDFPRSQAAWLTVRRR